MNQGSRRVSRLFLRTLINNGVDIHKCLTTSNKRAVDKNKMLVVGYQRLNLLSFRKRKMFCCGSYFCKFVVDEIWTHLWLKLSSKDEDYLPEKKYIILTFLCDYKMQWTCQNNLFKMETIKKKRD